MKYKVEKITSHGIGFDAIGDNCIEEYQSYIIDTDLGNNPSTNQLYSIIANSIDNIMLMPLGGCVEVKVKTKYSEIDGMYSVSDLVDYIKE